MKRSLRAGLALAAIVPAHAFAEDANVGSDADAAIASAAAPEREVIVITARGRAEDPFAAPAFAGVFGEQSVAEERLRDIDALAAAAPGFFLINDQDPGTNIISVRGVATDRLQAPSIAYVFDGVAFGDTEFFTARLYDVARIETLAGPQGALFGVNAAGGALNVVTRSPTEAREAWWRAGVGSGATREVEAAFSGPLGEAARARLAVYSLATDGHIRNQTLDRLVDGYESHNARLRLDVDLAPAWSLATRLEHREEDGGAAWASSNDVTGQFGGALDGAALTDPIGDFEGRADRFWTTAAAALTRSAPGRGELTFRLARDWYAKRWVEELDYLPGPLPGFPQGVQPVSQPTRLDVWTGETRYVSDDDARLRWIAGVFVQDIERGRVDDFGPLLFGPAPRFDTRSTNLAGYGEIAVDVTDALTLSAALRYDVDERSQTISSTADGAVLDDRSGRFDAWQPRVSAQWSPNANVSAYATYAQAFRTGGFNPAPVNGLWAREFAPEDHQSFELGLKLRNGPLGFALDAAAYTSRIENYQNYTFLEFQSVTLNVDEVEIAGLDVAASAQPVDGVTVSAAYALTDAEIVRFQSPDPFDSRVIRDYSGAAPPNVPAWAASASARVEREFGGFSWSARADVRAQGETFFEVDNVLRQPSRVSGDLRLSAGREGWSAALWVENVTDERWAVSAFGQGQIPLLVFIGPTDTFTINPGRRWGVELTARF